MFVGIQWGGSVSSTIPNAVIDGGAQNRDKNIRLKYNISLELLLCLYIYTVKHGGLMRLPLAIC